MVDPEGPFELWWDESAEVVQLRWATGAVVDEAAAEASTRAVRALGRDGVLLLVDARAITTFERGARTHFLADQAGSVAMALLVESAVNRMIANFFIGMHRQPVPVKMFTDVPSAVAWLHDLR